MTQLQKSSLLVMKYGKNILSCWEKLNRVGSITNARTSGASEEELVLACAGLHNFLYKECCSDDFLAEPENDPSLSYLDMEVENLSLLSQTQQQQRADANAWRLSIAEVMWNDRPQNNEKGNQEDNNESEEGYDDHNAV
ncbi:hypothetical protein LguiB_031639 [Lonicera macranthoides]